jgi:hypothetical protein
MVTAGNIFQSVQARITLLENEYNNNANNSSGYSGSALVLWIGPRQLIVTYGMCEK